MDKSKKMIKTIGVAVGVVLVAGAGVLSGMAINQNSGYDIGLLSGYQLGQSEFVPQIQYVEVPVLDELAKATAFKSGVDSVFIPEITTEIEYVEDDSFIKILCDKLMFEDVLECKEEQTAEDKALKLALKELEKESKVFDLLEDEGIIEDEDEAKIVRVYDDFEDIEIVKSDFDDEEYKFLITLKIEDEDADEKMKVEFEVEVEDGEVEIVDAQKL